MRLNDCYKTGARYMTMVEEYSIAVKGWFPRVLEALRDVETEMKQPPGARWMYLRLIYAEGLLEWNRENWPAYLFCFVKSWVLVSLLSFREKQFVICVHSVTDMINSLCWRLLLSSTWPFKTGIHSMNRFGCCF